MIKKHLRNLSFGLLGLMLVVLMGATCVEKIWGTTWVVRHIYGASWFTVSWALTAIAAILYLVCRRVQKHRATFCLHLSFVVILLGALVTHVWGVQGSVHLRKGVAEENFVTNGGRQVRFPFNLSLEEFEVVYYTGTSAPKDFVSRLQLTDDSGVHQGEVAMNRIFRYGAYRFYQSRYDSDGQGTTLSVACDPWGIGLTYAGYVCLLLSGVMFFFQSDSRFRQLLRRSSTRVAAVVCLLLIATTAQAQDLSLPRVLPRETAADFGKLYVYYNDRICPLQTLAKDFTVKLYGKTTYRGLSAEQVLTGWFFYYDDWKEEPCIRVKSREVRDWLGIEGSYASLQDFVGNDGYKLDAELLANASLRDARGVGEANEKFSIVSSVATGAIWKIFPCRIANDTLNGKVDRLEWFSLVDRLPRELPREQELFVRNAMNYVAEKVARKDFTEVEWILEKVQRYQQREAGGMLPSAFRFRAELVYNHLNNSLPLAVVFVFLGLLSLGYHVRCLIRREQAGRIVCAGQAVVMGTGLLWLLGLMVLRGVVSGHLPMSNGHETMHLLAVCAAGLALSVRRRFPQALPFGFLVCGLALMVSMLGEHNPRVTPLMPVLDSPLLSIHVVVIMIAYALLAFVMLNGVAALLLRAVRKSCMEEMARLQTVSTLMLYPAVFLLAAGIFVGAVWANVSWGRYWGWDPKEVWALVTMLVYALALHPGSLPCFRRPLFFHVFCIVAFLCVLATYFGVNFLLGGMHSYA